MKPVVLLILFFTATATSIFAQHFRYWPQTPTVNDSVFIEYDSHSVFENNDITCVVYFTGLNDRAQQRNDFPKARAITLKKSGKIWLGKIDSIPPRATAVVFAFTDSLNRDTNNGKGYYTPLYADGKPLPGAWAGIGTLLYGNWITETSPFHIRYDLDSAKKFYMNDFSVYPEVKREYFLNYLDILKINTPAEEKNYRKELEELAQYPDLSQNELLKLHFQYGRLKDTVNANKYERMIFKKYPNGSWTVQAKSLRQLMDIGTARDFEKQAKIYKHFKETYLKPYEDEFATITMNNRAGQMLSYMVEHFIQEGTLDVWKSEVNGLTDDGRSWAYRLSARELLGLSGRPRAPKSQKNNTTIEHPFLQYTINEKPDLNIKVAEELAANAVAICKEKFNELRTYNEPLIMTDEGVRNHRNILLSSYLEVLGISLLRQNKFSEGVEVMTEAVIKSNYATASINQTYIEALVKAGQIDKALLETEKIVSMGKNTAVIDGFYEKYKKKDDSISAFKDQSVESTKEKLKQRIIHEDMPDFTFYDLGGKEIKSSSLKNKIVVIDFWASWCPPCMIALNAADQVVDMYKHDADIVFLFMSEDTSKEHAMKVIDKHKNKSAFVFDNNHELVKKLSTSLPAQLVIDKNGKIRFRTNGLTSFNVQENAVELQAMIELLR